VPHDPNRKFLAKLNPNATPGSMARRAAINCVVAAVLYGAGAVLHFNPRFQPSWIEFALFLAIAAFVAVVCEWQDTPD
jgi:hypothetical protein